MLNYNVLYNIIIYFITVKIFFFFKSNQIFLKNKLKEFTPEAMSNFYFVKRRLKLRLVNKTAILL